VIWQVLLNDMGARKYSMVFWFAKFNFSNNRYCIDNICLLTMHYFFSNAYKNNFRAYLGMLLFAESTMGETFFS
jgi:hypothetical protein